MATMHDCAVKIGGVAIRYRDLAGLSANIQFTVWQALQQAAHAPGARTMHKLSKSVVRDALETVSDLAEAEIETRRTCVSSDVDKAEFKLEEQSLKDAECILRYVLKNR